MTNEAETLPAFTGYCQPVDRCGNPVYDWEPHRTITVTPSGSGVVLNGNWHCHQPNDLTDIATWGIPNPEKESDMSKSGLKVLKERVEALEQRQEKEDTLVREADEQRDRITELEDQLCKTAERNVELIKKNKALEDELRQARIRESVTKREREWPRPYTLPYPNTQDDWHKRYIPTWTWKPVIDTRTSRYA